MLAKCKESPQVFMCGAKWQECWGSRTKKPIIQNKTVETSSFDAGKKESAIKLYLMKTCSILLNRGLWTSALLRLLGCESWTVQDVNLTALLLHASLMTPSKFLCQPCIITHWCALWMPTWRCNTSFTRQKTKLLMVPKGESNISPTGPFSLR